MASNSKGKKGQKDPYSAIRCSNNKNCSSYLYPPILACSSGHNLCVTCLQFYQMKCPCCSETLSYKPNFSLEKISLALLTPCAFRNQGCHFQFPQQEIAQHQRICNYTTKTCFSTKCGWSGPLTDLIDHMESVHKERVHREPEVLFCTRKINSRKEGLDTISFITCDIGNFWVRFQFSEEDEQFYGAVQYLGPEQEAEKMECEFEMLEKDDDGEVTGLKCIYKGNVYTELDSFDDIFDNEQCFTVCLDFAKYFEYDDVLRIVARVRRVS